MTSWRAGALCRAFPGLPWIVEPHDRSGAATRALEAVCAACPVLPDCGEYVDSRQITSGFWAGRDRTPDTELERGGAA